MKKILAFLFAVSLFYFVGAQSVLASSLFNVEVRTYLDGSNMNQAASGLSNQARGSKVQFNASGISPEYTFAFYAVNDIVRDDLPQNYEFVVRSNMKITAFFRPNGSVTPANDRHVVIFADNNGKIISGGVQYVADGGTATEPSVLPTKPNATHATPKWFTPQGESSLENITSSRVYLLQYVSSDNTAYTVNVTGGSVVEDAPFNYNDVVTLVPNAAPAEQVFSHWEDAEGNVLSTKANYKFTVMGNVSVQAVFAASPEFSGAVVNMSDALSIRSGYVTYKGQFDLPAGFTLVEYGFIFSRSSDVLTLDSLGATIVPSNVHNGQTGEFLRSFPNDTFNSVRAYLIVKNAAQEEVIVYSTFVSSVLNTDLLHNYDFESGTNTSYVRSGQTNLGKPGLPEWTVVTTSSSNTGILWSYNGTQDLNITSAQGTNIGRIDARSGQSTTLTSSVYESVSKIVMDAKWYGTTTAGSIQVSYQVGSNTPVVLSTPVLSAAFNTFEIDVNKQNVKIILTVTGERVNIDNIMIYSGLQGVYHEVAYNNTTLENEFVLNNAQISSLTPTQAGYSFAGWYTDVALTQSYNVSTPVVQSLQLYAKWTINQYTISFDSAGGSAVSPITQDYNSSVIAPADPTREGYSFTGWDQAVPSNMPANNIELTAQWSINQYTITFDSNEGSAVSAITQDFGTSVSEPLDPTRDGYLFQGWFTDDNTFLNEYVFGTMPSQNITVYAKWEEQVGTYYTVTFNSNGGSAVSSQQVLSGDYADEPAAPTRNGYTFVNWQDESNVVWDFANDSIIEAMTLYATWSPVTYSLTFENLQGSTQSNPGTYNIETSTITLTNPSAREGYNFSGWFTALEGGSQVTVIALGSTGNLALYARWESVVKQATIDKYNTTAFTTAISDGLLVVGTGNNNISIANNGLATIQVYYYKNASTTTSIFNNSAGEIRLYGGSGNGGQLTITVSAGYLITSITVNTSTNGGFSINGGTTNTTNTTNSTNITTLETAVSSVILKNVASSTNQVRITDIIITYIPE